MKVLCSFVLAASTLLCQAAVPPGGAANAGNYELGPDDQISIRVQDLDKLQLHDSLAPRIDVNGNLNLPVIGHLHAQGLTVNQLEQEIARKLGNILQNPNVSVSIMQYRSHPVSVLGAVRNPGVLQVVQQKRLLEVLSLAGGLAPDAGDKIKISRRTSMGPLPLGNVAADSSGDYEVGQVDVRTLMQAARPDLNIEMRDNDVVTVPRAELIYVIGAVKKAGGFPLNDRDQMSILQALSLAEGFDHAASPKSARLLREEGSGQDRKEMTINLKPIMTGSAPDVPMRANDILFIPTSQTKLVSMRAIEAAISVGSGFAVFH